ncbi:MAG: hypothetical protein ABFE07_28875 [Armatimonadia bacterium]
MRPSGLLHFSVQQFTEAGSLELLGGIAHPQVGTRANAEALGVEQTVWMHTARLPDAALALAVPWQAQQALGLEGQVGPVAIIL